jgi:hypothetical protein
LWNDLHWYIETNSTSHTLTFIKAWAVTRLKKNETKYVSLLIINIHLQTHTYTQLTPTDPVGIILISYHGLPLLIANSATISNEKKK